MESIGSSSTPSNHHHHHHRRHLMPTQPLADRIIRAVSHHLRLLHHYDTTFFILGATGNVYTVNLSTTPSCSCPDRTAPCKHILFVFIRVLGVSVDDMCLLRRTLRPCELQRLLSLPISTESLANPNVRERFHQLFFQERSKSSVLKIEIEKGVTCPICLEEMNKEERVGICGTCKNPLHEECLMAWKRSNRRRSMKCVICRARWRDLRANSEQQDKYLNLSAYDDDMQVEDRQSHCGS
ncbi:mitogen-activated protein kinase kinase kinase 1-like [Solanum pennellii]|uniref:Mitogen-activated protein kinase kinase kinase 1-like n=1 Tax=Solanum pennellii TaxID=28526 RepID=A0ABM1HEZ5_SOLPN|nr:mitogen-activated protein kinase kinase kinase 1-like [Solanum pennellii]